MFYIKVLRASYANILNFGQQKIFNYVSGIMQRRGVKMMVQA